MTSTTHRPVARDAARYDGVAITLHWVLAGMVLGMVGVGAYMTDLALSPTRLQLFNWHKWAGVTVLALALLRLLWRLSHRPPASPPMPRWQQRAAHGVHAALYGLLLAMPLSGWAYSSAAGIPVVWFGVLPLPDFVPVDRELSEGLKTLHGVLGWALVALVAVHVAAALKHQVIDRDGLLLRMLPRRR